MCSNFVIGKYSQNSFRPCVIHSLVTRLVVHSGIWTLLVNINIILLFHPHGFPTFFHVPQHHWIRHESVFKLNRLNTKLCLPVWVLVWRFKSKVSLNPLPQNVHRYLFTSLWHFMWRFNNRWRLKLLEQRWQAKRVLSLPPVVDSTFSGSTRAGGGGGGMIAPTSWLARGFFTPWPPLTNSSVIPLGRPSWKRKQETQIWK